MILILTDSQLQLTFVFIYLFCIASHAQIIPEFARWLVTQTDYDWQHYPPDDSFAVTVLMHRFGINVRHLFYVYLSLEDIATPPTSAISDNEAKEESPTDRDRVSSPPTSPAAPSADSRVVHFAVSDATASSLGPPQSATSPAQLEPAPSPVSPTSDGRVPTPASRKSAIRSARAEYLSSGAHEAPPTATAPPVASKKTASNLSQVRRDAVHVMYPVGGCLCTLVTRG